jgi:hypothetical protein
MFILELRILEMLKKKKKKDMDVNEILSNITLKHILK